ncbi:YihY/virulence factor BrkB family protein [Planosporangium sp. 12N6]|uniref:YihY/virulence factor BrkB family protein n=1 Tax=Planosporangium spinosum TaxID=3402278 RepID=UPI003CE87F1D
MLRFVERVEDGCTALVGAVRRRSARLDHVARAYERFDDVNGWRLAAADAYYGFFAVFALAMLLFGVIGYILRDNPLVVGAVRTYLQGNLPRVRIEDLIGTAQSLGQLAAAGLALAGIGWVETLRSTQRAVWRLEEHPGPWLIRWLVDVAVLVVLGVLLTVSVSIAGGVQDLVLGLAGEPRQSALRALLNNSAAVFAGMVDFILGAALLAIVPRLRMPLRRLVPAALFFAFGLLVLKTLGRWYIGRTQHNPAYQVFAGAIGLLVFMYLFSQLVLFAAALAATSRHGTVRDLAAGPVQPDDGRAHPAPGPAGPGLPSTDPREVSRGG